MCVCVRVREFEICLEIGGMENGCFGFEFYCLWPEAWEGEDTGTHPSSLD